MLFKWDLDLTADQNGSEREPSGGRELLTSRALIGCRVLRFRLAVSASSGQARRCSAKVVP